jgi:hypothetical protein
MSITDGSTGGVGGSGGKDSAKKGGFAPKGLSNSIKTSGTSSLVGGGAGSSLTGKNPFAILKASAMPTS